MKKNKKFRKNLEELLRLVGKIAETSDEDFLELIKQKDQCEDLDRIGLLIKDEPMNKDESLTETLYCLVFSSHYITNGQKYNSMEDVSDYMKDVYQKVFVAYDLNTLQFLRNLNTLLVKAFIRG